MEAGTVPKSAPEQLRRQNPQGEGQNGEQIVQGLVQLPWARLIPIRTMLPVSAVAKDLAAVEIAVPVQQTAGQSQQKADWKRFRGLELFHGCASFRNPAQKDTTSFGIGQGEEIFLKNLPAVLLWREGERSKLTAGRVGSPVQVPLWDLQCRRDGELSAGRTAPSQWGGAAVEWTASRCRTAGVKI